MHIDYAIIGKQIRQHRFCKRITQEELAFRIGTSAAYISLIECGKKKPSLHKLTLISEALGVTVNDLLYGQASEYTQDNLNEINAIISHYPADKQKDLLDSITTILHTLTIK